MQHACYHRGVAEDRVAVFRRFHEAWTSGRLSDVLTLVDPDVVARPLHRAMFTRSEFRGREGIEDWFREMTDPWDRFETLVEDVKPTSTGAIGLLTLVGYRGDSPFHARVGVVCDVREGRIVRLTARNASDVEKEMKAA
jgi:ketosteroid isomerase-like protein